MRKKVIRFIKYYENLSFGFNQVPKYYKYIVIFITIFIAFYTAIPIYTNLIKFTSPEEILINYSVTFYLIITIDLLLQLYIIKQYKLNEINKLYIYPYPNYYIKLYPYAILFFDKKILIWIVFITILLLKYIVIKTNIYMLVIGLVVMTQIYSSINIIFYSIICKIINFIYKGNFLGVVIFLNVIIFNLLNISKMMYLLYHIPIIKNLTNIFSLSNNSLSVIIKDIIIINVFFIVSVVILIKTLKSKNY